MLVEILKQCEFKVLIVLGDLFNDLNFTRLGKEDWKLLSYLRKISKDVRVIWVEGNHDGPSSGVISLLLGMELVQEFEWEHAGEKYVAIHGHQFDHFIQDNPTITNIACAIYFTLQLMDKKTHKFSRFVKRISKKWLRMSNEVAAKATAYGEKKGRHVICGHTHRMTEKPGKFRYYNSGCWTDIPSSFLTVDKHGVGKYSVDGNGKIREEN